MVDIKLLLQNQALPGILRLSKALDSTTPIFREFRTYYAEQVDGVFEHLAHGGHHRGLHWKPFPQSALPHARKRTGMRWYAINGGGNRYGKPIATHTPLTLGRRRPSGRRLSSQSKLLQDRGALRKEATESLLGQHSLIYRPLLNYAEQQFAHRSPYSVTAADVALLLEITAKHITRALIGGKRA